MVAHLAIFFDLFISTLLIFGNAARATTHHVMVGEGTAFSPQTVTASAGDMVEFMFSGLNTATQVMFDTPCTAMEGGFDSGRLTSGKFTVQVNSSETVWVACLLPSHCTAGIVFAVNPPTSGDQTYQAFQAKAKAGGGSTTLMSGSAMPTSSQTGGGPRRVHLLGDAAISVIACIVMLAAGVLWLP
ncbi:hypothetical protein DL93DRAFT_176550 [Clavulina sp. PMI_390]|nr:hypothetical protein DL93DRAFT_176550 [Clavulina sp. PMI_390]